MIEIKRLLINKQDDWNKLIKYVDQDYIDDYDLEKLKTYTQKCDTILVEYPYYDKDYLSTYYLFYAKKTRNYRKQCYRLHIFYQKVYMGYYTLRPTSYATKIGRSYLNPEIFFEKPAYIMHSSYDVSIIGDRYDIKAFPWMQQETDITVCAHVAVWTILRYYGNKYKHYQDISMGSIIEKMPESVGRKVPTLGVSMKQIPDIFKKLDFSPIVIQKKYQEDDEFRRELFAYIESAIPVIACMSDEKHAISIIGHGEICYNQLDELHEELIYNADIIESVVVQDDNRRPYSSLSTRKYNPFYMEKRKRDDLYDFEDIDYLIIPLYQRMQLSYASVMLALKTYLDKSDFLDKTQKYVIRVYITASNSFKRFIYNLEEVNEVYRDIIIKLVMPRFIWCVDFSTVEEYKRGLVSAKIIYDSTCCNKEIYPDILRQNGKFIQYYDDKVFYTCPQEVKPYQIYINNLSKVGGKYGNIKSEKS